MTTSPTTYRERLIAGISRYRPADRDELIAFRRSAYSPSSVFCDPGYIAWSIERTPAAQRGSLPVWLFRKDGRIEGQQGSLPIRLKIGKSVRPAAWHFDLFVNPAFQLRGVGAVLHDVAFADTGLALGLEISDEAQKGYLKAGWVDLGSVPLYVRPMDCGALLAARRGSEFGSLGRAIAKVGNLALRGFDAVFERAMALSRLRVEARRQFDPRVDELWSAVSEHYPVIATRDFEMLSWRFDAFPSRDRYRIFYFFRGHTLAGYLVLRRGRWNGVEAGFIVDYLCAPEDTLAVLGQAIVWFRRSRPVAIYCLHRNPVSVAALRALGFIERDSTWRFMFRLKDGDVATERLLADPNQWFITLADADVDRPRGGTHFPPQVAWPGRARRPIES